MAEAVAILAPDMGHGGSVGNVAWRHALVLGRSFRVYAIARSFPPGVHPSVEAVPVRPATWNWLRRYCHVPNELSLLRALRRALADLCRRQRIEVVWCHSHGIAARVAAPLRKRFGFRIVMTTHGDIFDRPAGTYSRELTRFYESVTPRAYREADRVHALSPYMADLAVKGGASADRVRVVPNAVDPAEIGAQGLSPRAAASFLEGGRLRLLYVGSLWSVKGVDVLMRSLAELARGDRSARVPTRAPGDVVLTLAGEGTQRQELEALAMALGVSERVDFVGRVPRKDLSRCYRNADLLCIASRSEAFSLVAVEAMHCGLPVVGSATGGIPSLVEPGFNGYLATPGDPGSLAKAIATAAASRQHLAELGARGLQRARERYTWERVGEELAELARSVLPARRRGGE